MVSVAASMADGYGLGSLDDRGNHPSACSSCDCTFSNTSPGAEQRRANRKLCGKIDGSSLVLSDHEDGDVHDVKKNDEGAGSTADPASVCAGKIFAVDGKTSLLASTDWTVENSCQAVEISGEEAQVAIYSENAVNPSSDQAFDSPGVLRGSDVTAGIDQLERNKEQDHPSSTASVSTVAPRLDCSMDDISQEKDENVLEEFMVEFELAMEQIIREASDLDLESHSVRGEEGTADPMIYIATNSSEPILAGELFPISVINSLSDKVIRNSPEETSSVTESCVEETILEKNVDLPNHEASSVSLDDQRIAQSECGLTGFERVDLEDQEPAEEGSTYSVFKFIVQENGDSHVDQDGQNSPVNMTQLAGGMVNASPTSSPNLLVGSEPRHFISLEAWIDDCEEAQTDLKEDEEEANGSPGSIGVDTEEKQQSSVDPETESPGQRGQLIPDDGQSQSGDVRSMLGSAGNVIVRALSPGVLNSDAAEQPPAKRTSSVDLHGSEISEQEERGEIVPSAESSSSSSGKQHTPLKSLLMEANKESCQETLTLTLTLNPLSRQLNQVPAARREAQKEWSSPARLPGHLAGGDHRRKVKGRPQWVPFLCCPSIN